MIGQSTRAYRRVKESKAVKRRVCKREDHGHTGGREQWSRIQETRVQSNRVEKRRKDKRRGELTSVITMLTNSAGVKS